MITQQDRDTIRQSYSHLIHGTPCRSICESQSHHTDAHLSGLRDAKPNWEMNNKDLRPSAVAKYPVRLRFAIEKREIESRVQKYVYHCNCGRVKDGMILPVAKVKQSA